MVSVGSGYYHWRPTTPRLFWDRLPMAIGFMSLFAILIGEKINKEFGKFSLIPLLIVGAFSVLHWKYTEMIHSGDLRIYILVQFGTMVATPLILFLFPSRYSLSEYYFLCLVFYIFAKVTELLDEQIFHLTDNLVSGHTIKHLLSAVGIEFIVVMLLNRKSYKNVRLTL